MKEDSYDFFARVYTIVRKIPEGRVTSYGAIAKYLGSARSARMVGWAMNASHTQEPPLPAQRVVNRNGILTGKNHFGSSNMMQELLENEGLVIKDDTIVDFEQHFWDPAIEIT